MSAVRRKTLSLVKTTTTPAATPPKPPPVQYDPIFFPRAAIVIGTELTCYGRRDPASLWKVYQIQSFERLAYKEYRMSNVEAVQHMSDLVYMQRRGIADPNQPDIRRASFGALSYSAIWRLAQ